MTLESMQRKLVVAIGPFRSVETSLRDYAKTLSEVDKARSAVYLRELGRDDLAPIFEEGL